MAVDLRVTVRGDREVMAALRRLPPDANDELREGAGRLAQVLARTARGFASSNPQARRAASTVRVVRDRFPSITAGPHKLLMGSEFGAKARFGWYAKPRFWDSEGRQFRPVAPSYWFYLAHDRREAEIAETWNDVADRIIRRYGVG